MPAAAAWHHGQLPGCTRAIPPCVRSFQEPSVSPGLIVPQSPQSLAATGSLSSFISHAG